MAGYLFRESKVHQTVYTNRIVKINIAGRTQFTPELRGPALLGMYFNLDVPAPGSEMRKALNRGGVRSWFQEYSTQEADRRDETGYLGPIPIPIWGNKNSLWARTWPHTVDADPWEFCFEVSAYSSTGKEVTIPLGLQTRQIKIINDKT